jgi:hypothetical protein
MLGPDPVFSPNDPTLNQANYPQPPNSSHNPNPNPGKLNIVIKEKEKVYSFYLYIVPYGQKQTSTGANEFQLHVNPNMQNQAPPNFQLSNCQGRKRALLVGINYTGSKNALRGCINDVRNVKQFLVSLYHFKEEDMVVLTDDQADQKFIPTKENIKSGMKWLVHDAKANDS